MAVQHVVVVGGGLSGLVTAYRLAQAGARVTLLEARVHLGGELVAAGQAPPGPSAAFSVPDTDAVVDVGAGGLRLDGTASKLLTELGLQDQAVTARSGQTLLWGRGRLIPLPAGVGPLGPTRLGPVARSGLFTASEVARIAAEPLFRRKFPKDLAIGSFVSYRFGQPVVDKLIDPVLGNRLGANVHGLGLLEVTPDYAELAANATPLLGSTPVRHGPLVTWPGGLGVLVEALAAAVKQAGGTIRTATPVAELTQTEDGWQVHLATPSGRPATSEPLLADHVVVATAAETMSELLGAHSPKLAVALRWVRTASVATVLMAWPREQTRSVGPLSRATSVLLGRRQRPTLGSAVHLSRRWAHLARLPWTLVLASVGRSVSQLALELDDDDLVARTSSEYRELVGLGPEPAWTHVTRWPQALPQHLPGHLDRIGAARDQLNELGGISVAGSFVDGPGLAVAIDSGERAAQGVMSALKGAQR